MPGDTQQSDPMMGNRTGSSDSNHEKDKDAIDAKKKEKVRSCNSLHFLKSTSIN